MHHSVAVPVLGLKPRLATNDASMHAVQGPAGLLARFVADPPTTTMQRLKGILTVGMVIL